MIIWSGGGMLSALVSAAGLVSVLLDPALARAGSPAPAGIVLVWVVAAAFTWWLGTRFNQCPGRALVDPCTGQIVILRGRHILFWIPMQSYSVLMVLIGALSVLGAMPGGSPGRKAGQAARAHISAAGVPLRVASTDTTPAKWPHGRREVAWTFTSGRG